MRLFATLAALLAWASPAAAATVGATDRSEIPMAHGGPITVRTVEFTAAPGETNRLEIAPYSRNGVRLRDPAGIAATAPCVAEDAQTVVCPQQDEMALVVALGDGDDTLTAGVQTTPLATTVEGGDGNDVVELALDARVTIDGGPGDDTLTGSSVRGGPGADTLAARSLDYSDHTAGVTVDLAAGTAGAPGENDRVLPGATSVHTGPGPDVIRGVRFVNSEDGDDMIDGTPENDSLDAGPGDDVIRGYGGDDAIYGVAGDDRLDGGDGQDRLYGADGADVLDGGAGRDLLAGGLGADRLLARDGERDKVACADADGAATGLEGDRATVDTRDHDSWCERVTGARRLVLHGLTRSGLRSARIVVSCHLSRACSGRVRVTGGRAVERVRVPAGRRVKIRVTRIRPVVEVRIVTPTNGVLRATLVSIRP